MVFPLIPLYAENLGCTASQIGIAVGSFSVLSMFLAIPVGTVVDKKSVKWTLFLGVLCNIIYSLLLWHSSSLNMLMLAQICGGLGFLVLIVSSQAYISGFTDQRYTESYFGYLSLAAALGQTIGPYLGGAIISKSNFSYLFGTAVLFSITGLWSLGLRESGSNSRKTEQISPRRNIRLKPYLTDLPFLGILVFTFVIVFAVSLRSSFIPVLFKSFDFSEDYLGFLLSLFALFMTLVRLFMSKLLQSFSRTLLVYTAFACILIGISVLPHFSDKIIPALSMTILGIGFGISQPLSMVMVSDKSMDHTPGTAMGIRFTTITLATFLSPLISGLVVQSLGLEVAFYLPSVLIIGALGFIIALF